MNHQHHELMGELREKMGRNLMLFYAIERGLKMVLPYIHPDGSRKDGIASFQKYKSTLRSKTMGPVVGDWFESMEFSIASPEEKLRGMIEEKFKTIVASRNELVHGGLFELPGISTVDRAGIELAFRYLDEQYREAEWLYKWVSQQLLCWMTSLRLNKPSQPQEFEQLYRLIRAYVLSYTEWINLADPSDTDWPNTKIVRLLKLAEIHTESVEAWIESSGEDALKLEKLTLLSRAGKFIKSQDKDATPKLYGLKTLKQVLFVSGMFDIYESQLSERQGATVVYKSRNPPNPNEAATPAEPFVDQIIFGA